MCLTIDFDANSKQMNSKHNNKTVLVNSHYCGFASMPSASAIILVFYILWFLKWKLTIEWNAKRYPPEKW